MALTKADFHYELPSRLIARTPLETRTASRLLVVGSESNEHRTFRDLVEYLRPDDTLVVNDSKVIKARLHATKDSGGKAEILIERIDTEREALCQVRVTKPLKPNRFLLCEDRQIDVVAREGEFYRLRFDSPVLQFLEDYGAVPLPPYIRRQPREHDEARYQTVYARHPGAVAAPTAGLHFDVAFLDVIAALGVAVCQVTLHVGAGTFQPVREQSIANHVMHEERYEIPHATIERLTAAPGRVIAVGTTVVRALETWAQSGERCGASKLFIVPGFDFKVVDALVTNFHLPESTLLMLVSAFAGRERILTAYREAVDKKYRFYSYGDAMFMERMDV